MAVAAAVRRPARATTTSSTARRSTRRAGTRSCATRPAEYQLAGGELKLHAQPGRHLHGRHHPAAEQLPPPGRVARRRGLGDRDQDQQLHARRRLRPGRPAGLRGRRQLREVRRHHRRRTADGATGSSSARRSPAPSRNPQENATVTAAQADGPIWLRLTKAGNTYTGEYSFDGIAWTAFAGRPGDEPDGRAGLRSCSGSARRTSRSATRCRSTTSPLDGPDPSNCEQCDGPG